MSEGPCGMLWGKPKKLDLKKIKKAQCTQQHFRDSKMLSKPLRLYHYIPQQVGTSIGLSEKQTRGELRFGAHLSSCPKSWSPSVSINPDNQSQKVEKTTPTLKNEKSPYYYYCYCCYYYCSKKGTKESLKEGKHTS